MSVTIRQVLKQGINAAWPDIEEWVKSALGEDKSYTSDDVREACLKHMELWLVYNGELKGFLVAQIYKAPQCTACYAPWLGGKDLQEWVAPAFGLFKDYLREQGVKQYSFIGRNAWQKLIKADYSGRFYLINL